MSRVTAQALLVSGVTLLTLAGALVHIEPMAITLAALDPIERLAALGPAVTIVAAGTLVCVGALHQAPRAAWARLLGAVAAGAVGALTLAITAPQWIAEGASPVALLR